MLERLETKDVLSVDPKMLVLYAKANGWLRQEAYGKYSDIYVKNKTFEIILPRSRVISDYYLAVSNALLTFAQVEGRSDQLVLREVLQVGSDVVRVRAPVGDQDGSIAIDAGVRLFEKAREMILSAACAAKEPKRAYRLGSHKEALDYLHTVRLGQTERGSYVITLLSPVDDGRTNYGDTLFGPDFAIEPFERTVVRNLIRSLSEAHKIASGDAAYTLPLFDNAVGQGVNANLCEAVADLIEQGSGLDVAVTWSKKLPKPREPSRVLFKPAEAGVLRDAAEHLRNSEPIDDIKLSGYVRSLEREKGRTEGTVSIKAVVEGKLASVKMILSGKLYAAALDAHKRRRTILISGDLIRVGQRWHLEKVKNLVLDDEDGLFD